MLCHIVQVDGYGDIDIGDFVIKNVYKDRKYPYLGIQSDTVGGMNLNIDRGVYACAIAWFATNLYTALHIGVQYDNFTGLALVFSNAMRDPIVFNLVALQSGLCHRYRVKLYLVLNILL